MSPSGSAHAVLVNAAAPALNRTLLRDHIDSSRVSAFTA